MSNKNIRLILLLMLITIVALFVTQAYWFNKSFKLEERQLEDKLNIALRNVADQVLKISSDSTQRIAPVEKISSNEFLVKTDCYYTLGDLDSILKREFSLREISLEYDYMMLESGEAEIVLGNTVPGLLDINNVACRSRDGVVDYYDFRIRLNNKTTYLLNSLGIWMYSSATLLVILTVFVFIFVSILRGKKLAEQKSSFVNNMTHEFKTPISNIAVASDAIRNKKRTLDRDKLETYAEIIFNENDRLNNLVDNVLQLSSLEKNEQSFSFEEVNTHEIITEVSSRFNPVVDQRNGNINLRLNAKSAIVTADKLHLSNVVYNLIENALKYSKGKPEITIQTQNANGQLEIAISDKGVGINIEDQEKIFENFYRVQSGNLHDTKGFGLGLSYVKLVIEKHGGRLSFNSKEGYGSTFNVYLSV